MTKGTEIVRPFLFAVRLVLWISAVITMGLTAWAVTHLKGYRTIFTLVIAALTTAFYIPSLFTACMHRNRGYMLPLDIVFYALWLAAFIFVAQTDDAFNTDGVVCYYYVWDLTRGCTRRNAIEAFTFLSFFWTLCGLCLEILNIYLDGRQSTGAHALTHPEKANPAVRDGPVSYTPGANAETTAAPSTEPAPVMSGQHTEV